MKKIKITKPIAVASLEYIISVTAITTLLIAILGPNGIFTQRLTQAHRTTVNGMTDISARWSLSLSPSSEVMDQLAVSQGRLDDPPGCSLTGPTTAPTTTTSW